VTDSSTIDYWLPRHALTNLSSSVTAFPKSTGVRGDSSARGTSHDVSVSRLSISEFDPDTATSVKSSANASLSTCY
jgi:hypothetical protein